MVARVNRVGTRTGLQLQGHRDMQGFDSSSLAMAGVVRWVSPPFVLSVLTPKGVHSPSPLGLMDKASDF